MGIFDKLKNIIYDSVEIEVDEKEYRREQERKRQAARPVSKPVTRKAESVQQVSKPIATKIPNANEETEDVITERELFNGGKAFKFPITFSDEDLLLDSKDNDDQSFVNTTVSSEPTLIRNTKDPKRRELKSYKKNYTAEIEDIEINAQAKFTPSPVISPVYGVVAEDNGLKKKVVRRNVRKVNSPQEIDEIRRKAFGTLEDQIMTSMENPIDNPKKNIMTLDPATESLLNDLIGNKDAESSRTEEIEKPKVVKKNLDALEELDRLYRNKGEK